ncbi:MAG: hypothetical protein UU48_C0015G0010 [Candidatus Uhrbacteria bacterium GW2011_GWF2_41_16]|jgi:hypothetical protein|uniref:Uncharacterized protein n=2 Tax=Candidatus Uhriibacteriota TaxID=1752732 RepID=A0A0G0V8Z5_9BACT|nr:MAG: hypothetical protein UU35_C0016G0010 [Candidatus Uhrbacteria bacterium GW2011_GWC2_41_11]KKR97434.1 MAG: hypothetical protein UU48_C0015G0010 [Candidatus Uhrbacteria bacterium GW2011_GWF2_41_16]HBP00093.1 hypothetical protein [Candidatus Uhrbacteria bacterium]
MTIKQPLFILFLVLNFLLIGVGCPFKTPDSDLNLKAKEAAEALHFDAGDTFVIQRTVFGFGGLAEAFAGEETKQEVTLEQIIPGNSVTLSWKTVFPQKKEDGSFENKTKTGRLTSSTLEKGTHLFLPAFWQEGDQTLEDQTLIWLSKKQYEELLQTGKTHISLGLLDEKITSVLRLTDALQNAWNALQQKAGEVSKNQDVTEVTSSNYFTETEKFQTLMVNGVLINVRVIQASNWFASYVILANPENPLVLKVTPNPLSSGSFNPHAPLDILSASLGYEIREIHTKK